MRPAPVLSLVVLVKLASMAVHLEEFDSQDGHILDLEKAQELARSPDVRSFLREMAALSLVPVKRVDR